jgi:hypothetical protein
MKEFVIQFSIPGDVIIEAEDIGEAIEKFNEMDLCELIMETFQEIGFNEDYMDDVYEYTDEENTQESLPKEKNFTVFGE